MVKHDTYFVLICYLHSCFRGNLTTQASNWAKVVTTPLSSDPSQDHLSHISSNPEDPDIIPLPPMYEYADEYDEIVVEDEDQKRFLFVVEGIVLTTVALLGKLVNIGKPLVVRE